MTTVAEGFFFKLNDFVQFVYVSVLVYLCILIHKSIPSFFSTFEKYRIH